MEPEEQAERINKLRASTPEQRSERSKKAAVTRLASTTTEQRSERSKKAWLTRRANIAVKAEARETA
jgi:hypothetical protein